MEQITVTKIDGTIINLVSTDPFRAITSFSQEYGLMSDDYIKISVKSSDMIKFNIGDKITVGTNVYSIRTNNTTEIISDNSYTYELTFYGAMYDLMKTIYRNCDASGKSSTASFDLTYTLKDFIKVLIYNTNRDYPGIWIFDEINCPDTDEKTITFDSQNCLQVIQTLCNSDNFDYDFLITQSDGVRTLHVGKFGSVITPPNNSSYFEIGKGKGLYKLKQDKVDDKCIITRLYVEGGETNIRSEYRDYAGRLQLPHQRYNTRSHTLSDGTVIPAGSMIIGITDDTKRYFEDLDLKNEIGSIEDYEKTDDIYPHRTGNVTELGSDVYSFMDDTMDFDLNDKWKDTDQDYAEYLERINSDETRSDYTSSIVGNTKWLISDTTAKITFTSGYLAGQQFELKKSGGYVHDTKTFSLIKYTDERGMSFPSETSESFQIHIGDTYKITDINLPASYEDNAEEDLWFYGYDKFLTAKQPRVQYSLTFTEDFFKTYLPLDSNTDLFHVGDYIPIKDTRFNVEKNIRITKITRNLMKQYDYTIIVSDTKSIDIAVKIVNEVISHETIINRYSMKDPSKARRGWRTTEDLRNMVFDTDGYFDGTNIKPNSIDTNMLTVGSKSQQFVLVGVTLQANVNGQPNQFSASSGILAHLTIDENDIKMWNLTASSVTLAESGGYYVYAKCSKSGDVGSYRITQDQLKFEPSTDPDNYYFLIGIIGTLNTTDNYRDFTTTYGFTRINGRTITTGRIVSSDGNCYLDLDNNLFSIGDSNSSLTWKDNKLIIKGILVQDQGGSISELGLYRGIFDINTTYYKGDEVTYNNGTNICTYRYINTSPSKGNLPTNSTFFNVIAKGADGTNGENGNGIQSIDVMYTTWPSPTTIPTSGWQTTMPALGKDDYLWTCNKIIYTNSSTPVYANPACIASGDSLKTATEQYASSTSNTTAPTSGWQDTMPNIQIGYFIWTRSKITWQNGDISYTDAICVTGNKGETGSSVYLLDLTNESSSVTCDKSGNVVGTLQGTTAHLYYGSSIVSGVVYSAVFSGCSGSINSSTGVVTMSGLSSNTGTVTITATSGSLVFSTIYTITKVYAGADGSNAVTYYIIPSVSAIQKENDTLTPLTITCDKYKQIGGQTPVITTEKTLKYKQSNDSSETAYSSAITISSSATYIDFILYDTDGTTILDKERVPVVENGLSVSTIDVEYSKNQSPTTAPTSGWQTTSPAWDNGYYIWSRTVIQMADGSESTTDPVCISGGKGIKTVVEYYYKSTSESSLIGGSWQTTAPVWENGYYIWTKSIITYTDNSTGETSPINAMGNDGISAFQLIIDAEQIVISTDSDGKNASIISKPTNFYGLYGTKTFGMQSDGYSIDFENSYIKANNDTLSKTLTQLDNGDFISDISTNLLIGSGDDGDNVSFGVSILNSSNSCLNGSIKLIIKLVNSLGGCATITKIIHVIVNKKGDTGNKGNYFEHRYAVNGSPTVAPNIVISDAAPVGWSTSLPTMNLLQYMWITTAEKTYNGNLVGTWSTPQRLSGIQGDPGVAGPALTFMGVWSASNTYVGKSLIVSVVLYNSIYYIARYDVGSSFTSSQTPDTDTDHWNSFGASFSSVATGLLLAQEAYINNLIVSKLATSSNPYHFLMAILDSSLGIFRNKANSEDIGNAIIALGKDVAEMQTSGQNKPALVVRDAQWRGNYNSSTIYYKDDRVFYSGYGTFIFTHDWLETETPISGLVPTNSSYWQLISTSELDGGTYSEIGSDGVFTNGLGMNVLPGSSGIKSNVCIGALLQHRNDDASGISAAVWGKDQTTDSDGSSKSYGGVFNRLKVEGMYSNIKLLTGTTSSYNLTKTDYRIHSYTTTNVAIYLPTPSDNGQDVGLTYHIKKCSAYMITVTAEGTNTLIRDNANTDVLSRTIDQGYMATLVWDGYRWCFNIQNN